MRSGLLLGLALPLLVGACSGGTPAAPVSAGPVTLEIAELRPNGAERWAAPRAADADGMNGFEGDPQPVVLGCEQQLGVTVNIDKFYLRAPDACGASTQCGFLSIDLYPGSDEAPSGGGQAWVRGAGPTLVLELQAFDLSIPTDYTLVPSLWRPNGVQFTGPFTAEPTPVRVTLAGSTNCPLTDAGGAGGAGGGANEPTAGAGGVSGL